MYIKCALLGFYLCHFEGYECVKRLNYVRIKNYRKIKRRSERMGI